MPLLLKSPSLLSRLRRSSRIAMLLMLVMLLKVSGAYACIAVNVDATAKQSAMKNETTTSQCGNPACVNDGVDQADANGDNGDYDGCDCCCHQTTALCGQLVFVVDKPVRQLYFLMSLPSVPTLVEHTLRPPIA